MAHVYSAGGSRRAAVFTAIIGLHFAVLLLVLNDEVPSFPVTTRLPGPVTVLPPEPQTPVIVPPDEVAPPEAFGPAIERPDLQIPDFAARNEMPGAPTADGQTQDDAWPPPGAYTVRTPASLQGLSRDFAAVVRACYPAGARRNGQEGQLKLAVTIGTRGQVIAWRVVESTGFPRLDAAAPCVLGKLGFNAAREGGRSVESEVLLPMIFRLD
ncbi:MAG: TonB family protein [Steroidobacteraceae bacterium]